MIDLLRWVSWRHLYRDPRKIALSLAGVALGVAVFISIRLSNNAAYASFTSSIDAVAGKANLQVVATDGLGFRDRIFPLVREQRGILAATPIVEAVVPVAGGGPPVTVLGIDVFSDQRFREYQFAGVAEDAEAFLQRLLAPRSIILSTRLAERQNVALGDSLELLVNSRWQSFVVAGLLELTGPAAAMAGQFAVMDIAAAQEAFGKVGRLDRIDLIVPEGETLDLVAEALLARLPANVTVARPQNRSGQTVKMLEAFQLNLTALAFIATYVAMFLIYNTILTNAVRRRKEIGTLRAVGTSRRQIFALFLFEAAVIGVAGSALGLLLGLALTTLVQQQVTQTITALYIQVAVQETPIAAAILLQGFALGVITSLLAAVLPALEATRVPIRQTFSVASLESAFSLNYRRIFAACLGILLLAVAATQVPPLGRFPAGGVAAAFLLLLGFSLLTPAIVTLVHRLANGAMARLFGIEGRLANQYLIESLRRSSVAIGALMIAVAMLMGVDTMIASFRQTVDYWISQSMKADIYIGSLANTQSAGSHTPLPPEVVDYVRALPEVEQIDTFRSISYTHAGERTTLAAVNVEAAERANPFLFRDGDKATMLRQAKDGRHVLISETFALKHGKSRGDSLGLATPNGWQTFAVAGVFYDYGYENGLILLDRPIFTRLWQDSSIVSLAFILKDPGTLQQVKTQIASRFAADYGLVVYANRDLREEVFRVFDQTFAITYILEIIAIIIAAIGIVNTLFTIIVEREREFGILKSIGASAGQIRKVVVINAGLMAFIAHVIGCVTGLLLSLVLIFVINKQSFGWTIQFGPNAPIFFITGVAMLVTAVLAALWPAQSAVRRKIAAMVRYE